MPHVVALCLAQALKSSECPEGKHEVLDNPSACQLAWVAEPFPFVSWLALLQRVGPELPGSQCPCPATEKIGIGPLKCVQLLSFLADQRPKCYH